MSTKLINNVDLRGWQTMEITVGTDRPNISEHIVCHLYTFWIILNIFSRNTVCKDCNFILLKRIMYTLKKMFLTLNKCEISYHHLSINSSFFLSYHLIHQRSLGKKYNQIPHPTLITKKERRAHTKIDK